MHSVPIVRKHPTQQFWCGQSMDNSIVTYTAGERVKQQRKRTFKGHLNSGYACGITFSPDGKFVASGDGEGKLFFWDFKSTRTYRKLQAHDAGPCIDCAWHRKQNHPGSSRRLGQPRRWGNIRTFRNCMCPRAQDCPTSKTAASCPGPAPP